MLLDFTENFDLKNFKTYKDIYSISQLDKLDPKKLYRLTFKGNLSFNADIPSEYIIHKKIFYKEFGNLYSILMHKIPRSVIKKAFDKYGNGSISEYEYVNTITESSVIKPSDMDNVITTSDKEVYADPRNDYQGHTKEWYDGFQHGYSDGYEKGYEEGKKEGYDEGYEYCKETDDSWR